MSRLKIFSFTEDDWRYGLEMITLGFFFRLLGRKKGCGSSIRLAGSVDVLQRKTIKFSKRSDGTWLFRLFLSAATNQITVIWIPNILLALSSAPKKTFSTWHSANSMRLRCCLCAIRKNFIWTNTYWGKKKSIASAILDRKLPKGCSYSRANTIAFMLQWSNSSKNVLQWLTMEWTRTPTE